MHTKIILNFITIVYHRKCTFICTRINAETIQAPFTCSFIIVTFLTVQLFTLFAGLDSCRLIVKNISANLTNSTISLLNAFLTINYWAITRFCPCCMNLITNAAVFCIFHRNVPVPIDSPICSPWVLHNPLSLCVPNQQHIMIFHSVVRTASQSPWWWVVRIRKVKGHIDSTHWCDDWFLKDDLLDFFRIFDIIMRYSSMVGKVEQVLLMTDFLWECVRIKRILTLQRNTSSFDDHVQDRFDQTRIAACILGIAIHKIHFWQINGLVRQTGRDDFLFKEGSSNKRLTGTAVAWVFDLC